MWVRIQRKVLCGVLQWEQRLFMHMHLCMQLEDEVGYKFNEFVKALRFAIVCVSDMCMFVCATDL